MEKKQLKHDIAELAYNVTYGANLHFATFDIVSKLPGLIGFSSLSFGIAGLVFEITTNLTSIVFILLSIAALFIAMYEPNKMLYHKRGAHLNSVAGKLLAIYRDVDLPNAQLEDLTDEYQRIKDEFYSDDGNIGQQVLFSGALAHYKMFGVKSQQTKWFSEELELTFIKDKIPFFVRFFVCVLVVLFILGTICMLVLSEFFPFVKGIVC
ncbi:SLATT domain-containing protein [Aeromonas hydrophila]|uniref:SLATT domain-containing protein n=1 Tax=Aeromonas hydrophila TaxID=644 RepID=UPI000A70AC27|nr:SLATT domain-containing protein [Aeromonas hydrophila]